MGLYAQRYGYHPALFGFSLLNEPLNVNLSVLQDYYKRAYRKIRQYSPNSQIVISPLLTDQAGTGPEWTEFMNPNEGYQKVSMDVHYYSCFGGPPDQSNPDGAIGYIKWDRRYQIIDYESKNSKSLLIGEWSACGHFPDNRVGDFMRAQVDVYNTASLGWTFWSWTAPSNRWSMKTVFELGWMNDIRESVC